MRRFRALMACASGGIFALLFWRTGDTPHNVLSYFVAGAVCFFLLTEIVEGKE